MEDITAYLIRSTVDESGIVKAWEEDIMLPTYEIGKEEKNPLFLEKRIYQGSSGAVYPYSVIEKIYDDKKNKRYRALFVENKYLKIMILPELGGRLQMAYDKVRTRHFVYYNQVIKPALVGLTGPWISGGIEFNWPQHHRPSTFLPSEYLIENNEDGSKTVWCSEIERMFRTKGMHGFTLYPDKAYLEIKVNIYNRTPFPQTFLWWANPAVSVNDAYKSVFPPDVNAVFDHGKRDVSSFPIATGVYYKQDYSPGTDISRYKNIPVPTSYMAIQSKYDFMGGYEDDTQCGLLHVANHHISPGKKQWTWGCGDFGKAWDRNLTDEDGPYIELMTGVYTDNQPDFSWLNPYEEKTWSQYFMPYAEVGYVKNATKDIVANLEIFDKNAIIILYSTSRFQDITVCLKDNADRILFSEKITITPETPYKTSINLYELNPETVSLCVVSAENRDILVYHQKKDENKMIPNPAQAVENPKDIQHIEQLFLSGLHLEQYRHATFDPLDYYTEALNRDAGDVRCNNAVGLLLLRRGQFEKAQRYFEKAIETITQRNPNPYDGEPYYNLGCCLKLQSRIEEAYNAFSKSTWNAAWAAPSYFSLAQIDCIRGDWEIALSNIEKSLIQNWHNHKARQLKASILRKIWRKEEALKWIEESLQIDGFNIGCLFERYLLTEDQQKRNDIQNLLQDKFHTYLEYALDFAEAGLNDEAIDFLLLIRDRNDYPMTYYTLGYINSLNNNRDEAKRMCERAASLPADKCFPNRVEEVIILKHSLVENPSDAKALYYLGNFWYASKQYEEAIDCWEKSISIDDTFPTVFRNLALAYYNKTNKKSEAEHLLEKAFSLDTRDSRILMELDQLYKKKNYPPQKRLVFLEEHIDLVEERDDLSIERISLYNCLGNYNKAKELLNLRHFHPWEGGEGKVPFQYTFCRIQLAKQEIERTNFDTALELLNEIDSYPPNLGEGKLSTMKENDVEYYKGICYRGLKNEVEAKGWFSKATKGLQEPQQAFFYNDENPDKIFYQGLAWRALGDEAKANERFTQLIEHGKMHLNDTCKIDYFAVSLPDLAIWDENLDTRNRIHCYYVMALGYLGLNETEKAGEFMKRVEELDVNNLNVKISEWERFGIQDEMIV